jgi:hypothetical protein
VQCRPLSANSFNQPLVEISHRGESGWSAASTAIVGEEEEARLLALRDGRQTLTFDDETWQAIDAAMCG